MLYVVALCRYLIDVIVAYEEDGQVACPDYEEGIKLNQSYSHGRRPNNAGCCGNPNPNSASGAGTGSTSYGQTATGVR